MVTRTQDWRYVVIVAVPVIVFVVDFLGMLLRFACPTEVLVGEPSVEVEELRVDVEELRVDVEELRVDVAELPVAVEELPVDVDELPVDVATELPVDAGAAELGVRGTKASLQAVIVAVAVPGIVVTFRQTGPLPRYFPTKTQSPHSVYVVSVTV